MPKRIICLIFLLMISIFFVVYDFINESKIENKKVLVVGNVIVIEEITNQNFNEFIKTENVGVMTAIDLESNKYTAFAHKIDYTNNNMISSGCYNANQIEICKGKGISIGKLLATKNNDMIGTIAQNTKNGVVGQITNPNVYNETSNLEFNLCSKYNISKGDAKIYANLDGAGLREYDIKIEEINYFDSSKNMSIKVTDKELVEKTGGIVKGMSGSPIIQNGKLIGAINSVVYYDKTQGYATFASELFDN